MKLSEIFFENYKKSKPVQTELDFETNINDEPASEPERYHILINGRLWKKRGEPKPVVFDSRISANKAVRTIITKYNRPAQVVIAQKKDL